MPLTNKFLNIFLDSMDFENGAKKNLIKDMIRRAKELAFTFCQMDEIKVWINRGLWLVKSRFNWGNSAITLLEAYGKSLK